MRLTLEERSLALRDVLRWNSYKTKNKYTAGEIVVWLRVTKCPLEDSYMKILRAMQRCQRTFLSLKMDSDTTKICSCYTRELLAGKETNKQEAHTYCFIHCRAKSLNLLRCWTSLKPERNSQQRTSKHTIWGTKNFQGSPYRSFVALWAVLRLGSFGTVTFDTCRYKYIK